VVDPKLLSTPQLQWLVHLLGQRGIHWFPSRQAAQPHQQKSLFKLKAMTKLLTMEMEEMGVAPLPVITTRMLKSVKPKELDGKNINLKSASLKRKGKTN
jgi:hypothetical protein